MGIRRKTFLVMQAAAGVLTILTLLQWGGVIPDWFANYARPLATLVLIGGVPIGSFLEWRARREDGLESEFAEVDLKPVPSGRSYMSCGQAEQPVGRGLNFLLANPEP